MIIKYLWIAGSFPFILLGTIHLVYTFFSQKLSARDTTLNETMKKVHPVLTTQTTMYRAWTGFNASHSAGAIYIGVVNTILAIAYCAVLQHPFIMLLNIITVLFYVWLAKRYWFSIPLKGMSLAAVCYTAAVIVTLCS
jgi:hypothetical protein